MIAVLARIAPLFALLAALLSPAPAAAWWEYGHETVAAIAQLEIQPRTRAEIARLLARRQLVETPTCPLGTMEQASIWADCIKPLGDRFSYAYNWHYQNVNICKPFDIKAACPDGNCVSAQVSRAQRMLADRKLPTRDRIEALAFLIHFVGDLHQPLHAGDHEDLGGNRTKAAYGVIAGRTNLHTIWDGLLADRAISSPPDGATGLLSGVDPAGRARFAAGTVEDWSRESWQLARDAYGALIPDPCGPAPERARMDEATIRALIPLLRETVLKGGLRLARLLDEALDGDHPEIAHPPRPRGAG